MTELPAGRVCVYGQDRNASTPDSFNTILLHSVDPFSPPSRNEEILFSRRIFDFRQVNNKMYRVESHKSKSSKNNSVPLIAIIRYTTLFAQKSKKKKIRKIFRKEIKSGAPLPRLLHTPSPTATRITNFRVLPRSRVSYARQIAVMTVHRGKKCHVRGKQNVSRAYVPPFPSPPPSLFSSRPRRFLHTARRCL